MCGGVEEEGEGEKVGRGGEKVAQREGKVEGGATCSAKCTTSEGITK